MVVARREGWGQQLRRQDQRSEIVVVAEFGAVGAAAAACGAERAGTRRRLPPEEAERHLHRRSLRVGLGEVLHLIE